MSIARPRLYASALAGLCTFAALPSSWPLDMRSALAWDIGGLIYLGFVLHLMARYGVNKIKTGAVRRDAHKSVILGLVICSIAASVVASAWLTGGSRTAEFGKLINILLASATVIVSWCLVQFVFALHYARAYYVDRRFGEAPRLHFGDELQPDYWDFLYFSVTIGVSSATSDVNINSGAIRRLVTVHSAIAFFFNTALLALMLSFLASAIA